MVTRVRIDAEGSSVAEVDRHLDAAFDQIFPRSAMNMTFTWTGASSILHPGTAMSMFPSETEFVEEVIESRIRDDGAIYYHGRRVIAFHSAGP